MVMLDRSSICLICGQYLPLPCSDVYQVVLQNASYQNIPKNEQCIKQEPEPPTCVCSCPKVPRTLAMRILCQGPASLDLVQEQVDI